MNPITVPGLLRKAADLIDSGESPFPTDAICQAAGLDKTQDDTSRCSSYRFRRAATLVEESQCWSFYQKALEVVAATKKRAIDYMREYTDLCFGGASADSLKEFNDKNIKPELNAYTNQILLVADVFGVPEEKVYDDVCDLVDGDLPKYEPQAKEQPERKEPSEMLREAIEKFANDRIESVERVYGEDLHDLVQAVKAYYEVAR